MAVALALTCATSACAAVLGLEDVIFTPADDAGSPEASSDARSSDVGAESSLPRTSWCDAQTDALFCDDFDNDPLSLPDGAVPRGWNDILASYKMDGGFLPTNGSFQIDPLFQSEPSSLRAQIAANQPNCAYQRLDKVIDTPTAFDTVDFGFDIRVGDANGDFHAAGAAIVADLTVKVDQDAPTIYMSVLDDGRIGMTDLYTPLDGGPGTGGGQHFLSPLTLRGVWVRANVHLDLIASKYTVTFAPLTHTAVDLVHPIGRPAKRVETKIGFSCLSPGAGPMEVRYDNLTVTVK